MTAEKKWDRERVGATSLVYLRQRMSDIRGGVYPWQRHPRMGWRKPSVRSNGPNVECVSARSIFSPHITLFYSRAFPPRPLRRCCQCSLSRPSNPILPTVSPVAAGGTSRGASNSSGTRVDGINPGLAAPGAAARSNNWDGTSHMRKRSLRSIPRTDAFSPDQIFALPVLQDGCAATGGTTGIQNSVGSRSRDVSG